MRIGVIGGTGREGRGLALRWARAGHQVAIGSRDRAKAVERADAIAATGARGHVSGGDNAFAVSESDVVVLCVPYGAHAETLRALRGPLEGRVLVDITVPLVPPKIGEVHLPAGNAAALEAQAIVAPSTRVVAALHHISSIHLAEADRPIDSDVLVCSDDDEARGIAMSLVGDLGLRALDAGPLRNAIALEALTPVLLHLNKRYRSPGAGIRFTF